MAMGYALRHVTDLETTFREYQRVLKPGGKVLILEVTKPSGRMAGAQARAGGRSKRPTRAASRSVRERSFMAAGY